MNPVGQRLEPGSARRRGEPAHNWNQDPVAIPQIFPALCFIREGIGHIPPLVDYGILPPILLQPRQHRRIGSEIGFIDGQPVSIPTIPPPSEASGQQFELCLLYTSPSPRDRQKSRMPSSA